LLYFDIRNRNHTLNFVKSRPIRLPLKTAPFGSPVNTRKLNFSSLSPTPKYTLKFIVDSKIVLQMESYNFNNNQKLLTHAILKVV